jgi:hypothetical protein
MTRASRGGRELGFESRQVEVTGRYSNRQLERIAPKLLDWGIADFYKWHPDEAEGNETLEPDDPLAGLT